MASTAKANATSVEIGIAHADAKPDVELNAKKISAEVTMPPRAATIGTAAIRGFDNVPTTNSCLSSTPTTKKKMASSRSATHACTDR